jgi:putative Mn2+ efflux pump MntP
MHTNLFGPANVINSFTIAVCCLGFIFGHYIQAFEKNYTENYKLGGLAI